MAYFWVCGVSWKSIVSMTGFSFKTVTRFLGMFRRLVTTSLEFEDTTIGGPDVVVEIDETKLGKRKYNRGHRVEGVWVIVGVERTPQRRVFLVPVIDRSAETIHGIVRSHVSPGSIIHTDGWRGYTGIDVACSVKHCVVNHSVGFIDQETGVHTNTAEGTNYALKRQVPTRSRVKAGIEGHLGEFVWRRQNEDHLWMSFIKALSSIIPEPDE